MEGAEGSVMKNRQRDFYSHLTRETPSKSNTQPIQYVIVDEDDDEEEEEEDEVEPSSCQAEKKPIYIPPWRKDPSSNSSKGSLPRAGVGNIGSKRVDSERAFYRNPGNTPVGGACKARNLSLVEEQEISGNMSGMFLKPRRVNSGVGIDDVINSTNSYTTPAKLLKPDISGENKENQCVPGYTPGGYTNSKHRSVSCTALPSTHQTPRQTISHSLSATRLPSHKPTPLATRSRETTQLVKEESTSQSQVHSDSGCYDLPNLKSKVSKNVQVQTNSDWRKKSAAEDSNNSTLKLAACCCPTNTTGSYGLRQQCCRNNGVRNVAVQTDRQKNSSVDTSPVSDKSVANVTSIATVPDVVIVNNRAYTVLSLLGTGGSSKVEQVFDFENAKHLALKTVNLENQPPLAVASFKKEIEILEKLQFSDKVIKLIDSESREKENKLFLLLECGDTDLAVYLKRKLQENSLHRMQRCVFWHDMLQAVLVLHNQGIVHSDIKPANFMLVSGEIKLIDFGIARQLDADATSMVLENCVGTLNYMSPEVLQGIGSKDLNSKAGRKADVWSLGCILYYMTYGYTPFQSITTFIPKLTAITNPRHVIEMSDVGEPLLLQTMQMCLERDYKKRASIEELLLHPYVRYN